jgi:Lipocalin-like domain
MKTFLAPLAALAVVLIPLGARADEPGIVGTWRLVSYEDKPSGGESVYPYGREPKGLLMYDAAGYMSIQIMKVPHPKVASGDDSRVTPEEKQALYDAYVAYFGTYSIEPENGLVIHHVEADLADVFIGNAEKRPFVLRSDTLIIAPTWELEGREWHGIRVFERVR